MLFLCQLPLKHRRKRHCKQQITTLISATRNVCAGAATSVKRENSCPTYSRRRRWSSQTGHCGGVGTCSWGRGTGGDMGGDTGRDTAGTRRGCSRRCSRRCSGHPPCSSPWHPHGLQTLVQQGRAPLWEPLPVSPLVRGARQNNEYSL